MSIYLVQHGKSLPKEEDPERGLSKEGKEISRFIAEVAKEKGISVSEIKHSGKKRAFQTAEIFNSLLNVPSAVQEMSGLNPMDDVKLFAGKLDCTSNIMYVGHLPFMEKLVSCLITGEENKLVIKFQNSCIVCLDTDKNTENWFIKWSIMPEIN